MTIVVTGAGKGIGFEVCMQALQRGLNVIAISRNTHYLNNIDVALKSNLQIIESDLTKDDAIATIVNQIKQHYTQLHVLVNNAGLLVNKPFVDMTPTDFDMVYQTNVKVPYFLIQQLIPLFGNSSHSHIVNVSSMGGVNGSAKFPGLSVYSSSKGALTTLTECLAEELKETSIRINALALGAVDTEMLQGAFPGYKANVTPIEMGKYILDFATATPILFNGKVLQVSSSTP